MLPSGCFVRFLLSAVYLCKITSVLIQQRLHIDDCPTHEDASGEVWVTAFVPLVGSKKVMGFKIAGACPALDAESLREKP